MAILFKVWLAGAVAVTARRAMLGVYPAQASCGGVGDAPPEWNLLGAAAVEKLGAGRSLPTLDEV
ncbi:hypothetical protein [Micromonospora sp. NPDC050200]|uniref:hypothetical protein n=1 Tax=Micromonospora sp. NPDC050200 TaxID=3155664 RepID=UPI0033F2D55C